MVRTQPSDPQVAHGAEHFPVRLADALRDLGEAKDEARDKGFPTPADVAYENANRLLKEMYPLSRRRFEVYPMPDGEIAIGRVRWSREFGAVVMRFGRRRAVPGQHGRQAPPGRVFLR